MLRTNTLVSSESFLFLTCLDKQSAQPFQVVLWIHIAVLIFYMEATTMSNKNHLVWITCCLDKFYQCEVITRILEKSGGYNMLFILPIYRENKETYNI
jgi:hypothetical protein